MRKYIKFVILALVFSLLLFSIVLLSQLKQNSPTDTTSLRGIQRLSTSEYKQTISNLANVIKNDNPRVAVKELKKLMAKNPKVLGSCHELLHEIGFQAVKIVKTTRGFESFLIISLYE